MAAAKPHNRDRYEPRLSPWETGVLAHYAVSFKWARGAALLKVPEPVAKFLLAERDPLEAIELTGDPVTAFHEWAEESPPATPSGPLPGVLDDTPVSGRLPVTSGNLDALVAVGGWLYQVWSVSHGMEVLHVDGLRSRLEAGWHGVIVAGPGDLPASLIDPWVDEVLSDVDREAEIDPLSLRRGATTVVSLTRDDSPNSVEGHLRALALARSAGDLRAIGGERGSWGSDDHLVWYGLLDFGQLDLAPFRPPSDEPFLRGGLDLPLGVLATAQIYSTNTDGAGYKGHSPSCAHAKSGRIGLDMDFELATVRDLINDLDPEWCSKCGGYALRRLDDAQVRHYRNSHRLLEISRQLDRREGGSYSAANSMAQRKDVFAELNELANYRPDANPWHADARAWHDIVQMLRDKAGRLSVVPS
jgi:hypothetical protein